MLKLEGFQIDLNLEDLNDVSFGAGSPSTIDVNDVMLYDGSNWINTPLVLSDMINVSNDTNIAEDGQHLVWDNNSNEWINSSTNLVTRSILTAGGTTVNLPLQQWNTYTIQMTSDITIDFDITNVNQLGYELNVVLTSTNTTNVTFLPNISWSTQLPNPTSYLGTYKLKFTTTDGGSTWLGEVQQFV